MPVIVVMLTIADHEVRTPRKAIVPKEKLSLVYNAGAQSGADLALVPRNLMLSMSEASSKPK
jgi:hypothetical protein